MSLVPTFPWTAFVFAVRNRNRANKNEIAVLVFSVTTNNFPHVHTPFLYGTDVTALRYRIPDVAPLNEVCTGLKAEASRAALTFCPFFNRIHSLLRIQAQILYRSLLLGCLDIIGGFLGARHPTAA